MIDRRGRTFVRDRAGGFITTRAGILPIHSETFPGSGVYTVANDLTPERILTGGNDGWRINSNGWHFALGSPAGRTGDGWIGFGGRGGQNFMFSRLQGIGYLHGPTRTWRDLGGAPTYNRANLTAERVRPFVFGGETFSRKALVNWNDLWPGLPQGRVDLELVVFGHKLKEFIRITQAARNWIATNRPPLTPLNETWLGFLWELDLSDVPKIWQGRIIGRGDDFEDTAGNIELRDALSRPLGHIVPGKCWIDGARRVVVPNLLQRELPAIQRFWNGDRFFVGIRADHLAAMAAGDLIIDPPQTTDTAAGADDGFEDSSNNWQDAGPDNYLAGDLDNNVGMRFQMSAMNGNTVTVATLSWDWGADQNNTGTFTCTLRARDVANAPAYSNSSLPSADVAAGTTATATVSQTGNPTASSADSESVLAPVDELEVSYDDTIDNLRISWDAVTADGDYLSVGDAEAGGTIVDPSLSVTQAAGGQTIVIGLTEETDTAFAAARLKTRAIGLNTETDAALAAIVRRTYTIGLTTETDSAFAITWSKLKAIGLTLETDLAQAVTRVRIFAIGLISETDSAFSVTWRKLKAISLALETDSALALEGAAPPPAFVLHFPLFFPLWRLLTRRRRSPKPYWEQD